MSKALRKLKDILYACYSVNYILNFSKNSVVQKLENGGVLEVNRLSRASKN